jgi:uncharacterized protein YggE
MSEKNSSLSAKLVALSLIVALVAVTASVTTVYMETLRLHSPVSASVAASDPSSNTSESTISVTGVGTVYVQPSQTLIDLGVVSNASNVTTAVGQNDESMNSVIAALKSLGIDTSQIQTTQFSVNPQYNYNDPTPTLTGYQVVDTVQITLNTTNTTVIGIVINTAVAAGANQVNSVSFALTSAQQALLQHEALQNAVGNANATAQETASAVGLKIVRVQSITVLSSSYPQFSNIQVYQAVPNAAYSISPPPIYAGQSEYTMVVQVTYLVS